jgi:hypothetical protein
LSLSKYFLSILLLRLDIGYFDDMLKVALLPEFNGGKKISFVSMRELYPGMRLGASPETSNSNCNSSAKGDQGSEKAENKKNKMENKKKVESAENGNASGSKKDREKKDGDGTDKRDDEPNTAEVELQNSKKSGRGKKKVEVVRPFETPPRTYKFYAEYKKRKEEREQKEHREQRETQREVENTKESDTETRETETERKRNSGEGTQSEKVNTEQVSKTETCNNYTGQVAESSATKLSNDNDAEVTVELERAEGSRMGRDGVETGNLAGGGTEAGTEDSEKLKSGDNSQEQERGTQKMAVAGG